MNVAILYSVLMNHTRDSASSCLQVLQVASSKEGCDCIVRSYDRETQGYFQSPPHAAFQSWTHLD